MKYNLKILFVIDSLNFGGAERQLVELIKGLCLSASNKYDIHLAVLSSSQSGYLNIAKNFNINIISVPRKQKYNIISPLKILAKHIKNCNIDLVYGFMNMGSLFGSLAAKITRRPVICSPIRDSKDSSTKEKYLKLFFVHIADILVSNSWAGFHNRFKKLSPHFRVIYNGIDFSRFSSANDKHALRNELGISRFSPVIGSVASLSKNKDHFTLLQAYKIVLESFPDACLLLIGDGSNRQGLQKLAKDLKIEENTLFLGYRSDVEQLYYALDIHIMLTNTDIHFEGLSNSIIEAMFAGVPVIATDAGGTPEIIDNGVDGILVPPQNVTATAKALKSLIEEQELARDIADAARKKVVRMFSMDRYIGDNEKIIQELISKKKSAKLVSTL